MRSTTSWQLQYETKAGKRTHCVLRSAIEASLATIGRTGQNSQYEKRDEQATEDASSPSGPARQLLSVPQSKKPRVVTSTSSWCTRLITTTPRNYMGCNNLNKNEKEIAIPALDGWATWVHRWRMPQTSYSRVPSLRYDMVSCVYTSQVRWAV